MWCRRADCLFFRSTPPIRVLYTSTAETLKITQTNTLISSKTSPRLSANFQKVSICSVCALNSSFRPPKQQHSPLFWIVRLWRMTKRKSRYYHSKCYLPEPGRLANHPIRYGSIWHLIVLVIQ